ncbi:trypsin-like serine protease [Alloactinosynnema sp. L-07]|uniref:S1 family peptidase n=1 Tax=Alloactinosynnema sp. L-07 TaxID=1653480 RepID=UPI0006B69DA8|nr:trypsin-like serine protease [Alloactinosynnema sp. L-07]
MTDLRKTEPVHTDQDAIRKLAESIAGDDRTRYLLVYQALANQVDILSASSAEDCIARAREVLARVGAPYRPRTRDAMPTSQRLEGLYEDPVYLANSLALTRDEDHPGIIGGEETDDYPDCVAVGNDNGWCCTGTVIAPTLVVTAGHCLTRGCSQRVFTGVDVHFPDHGEVVQVDHSVAHPAYKPPDPLQDIAVLVLAEPVAVEPRAVATAEQIGQATFVRLAGYGNTDVHSIAGFGRRRMVDVPMAGKLAAYGADFASEFVAGRPFLDRDSCNGDSGGPAYVKVGDQWLLAGATSRATKSSVRPCGDGGIYTRVDAYQDWIMSLAT